MISGGIFSKQQLVKALIALIARKLLFVAVFNQIKLATNNRLYNRRLTLDVVFISFGHEFKNAKHITVIGKGNGGHFVIHSLFKHLANLGCAIEYGVF
jgi:hypothetical protein